jgi:L-lactate permease
MFQQNELITSIVVAGILAFLVVNWRRVKRNPSDTWLFVSFLFYAVAMVITVTEHFFLPELSNILEHLCLLLHTILFTAWIWQFTGQQTEIRE